MSDECKCRAATETAAANERAACAAAQSMLTWRQCSNSQRCCLAGMTNGNLFRKLMGNSPGGVIAQHVQGQPPIYLSAGLQDAVFPIAEAGDAVRPRPASHARPVRAHCSMLSASQAC